MQQSSSLEVHIYLMSKFFTFYSLLDCKGYMFFKTNEQLWVGSYFSLHVFPKYLLETT